MSSHCADDDLTTRRLMLVTASVDKLSFFKPLNLTEDLTITGAVAWVGRFSMEIQMEVIQPALTEEQAKEDCVDLVANCTLVGRDTIPKKTAQRDRLVPKTEAEKKVFQLGEARDAKRVSKDRCD